MINQLIRKISSKISRRAETVKVNNQKLRKNHFPENRFEGHESSVLPDIAVELSKVQYMFLEYHSFINSEQELDEILRFIKSSGMRYYIKESAYKKYSFIEREMFLEMDTIVNIFCYRV